MEVRSTSARAIADRKDLQRRAQWRQEEAIEWQRKAEVAVNKGRDDLAKGALAEAKKCTDQAELLNTELDVLTATLTKLGEDVSALQDKIKDAKARQNAIIMRGKAAHSRLGVRRTLSDHNIDDAIIRFEQYERKMDDLEGQVEAYDLGQKTLADEITELEGNEDLDAMLSDLKQRMNTAADPGDEQGLASNVDPASDKQ